MTRIKITIILWSLFYSGMLLFAGKPPNPEAIQMASGFLLLCNIIALTHSLYKEHKNDTETV